MPSTSTSSYPFPCPLHHPDAPAVAGRLTIEAIMGAWKAGAGDRPPADELISTVEAASILNRSVRTLQLWRRKGLGPPFNRLSERRPFYLLADVEAYATNAAC